MGYYSEKLSAERLREVYALASPRVMRYLNAEIHHCIEKIRPPDTVLELGCGYGRVMKNLAPCAKTVVGIDSSPDNLIYGEQYLKGLADCRFLAMDAAEMGFKDGSFDVVVCLQNGISAFNVDKRQLIRESVRVTKPGGIVLFSSYAAGFWKHRLEWFKQQAEAGLLGEIDFEATGDGVIVCKDGFRATTVTPEEFLSLTSKLSLKAKIEEVDGSSVFCEVVG